MTTPEITAPKPGARWMPMVQRFLARGPLEVALWDLIGQVAGLPIATLFGGASDGIPASQTRSRIVTETWLLTL